MSYIQIFNTLLFSVEEASFESIYKLTSVFLIYMCLIFGFSFELVLTTASFPH